VIHHQGLQRAGLKRVLWLVALACSLILGEVAGAASIVTEATDHPNTLSRVQPSFAGQLNPREDNSTRYDIRLAPEPMEGLATQVLRV
jgi:hypothetical protein